MTQMTVKTKRLSKKNQPLPLWWQLKEKIKEQIASNRLRLGNELSTEFQLMSEYEVSRITVVKALSELKSEGLIYSIQGKGTFVKGNKPVFNNKEIVGLIMPTVGHIFEPLSKKIIHNLSEYHYFCLVVNLQYENKKIKNVKKIKSLIDRHPGILVIHGISIFPFKFLNDYHGKIIFINCFEGEKKLPRARYVLSDYFEGGRLVSEHFISLGYKKIFFYTYPVLPDNKSQRNLIDGVKQIFREKNIPEKNFIIFTEDADILKALEKEEKPMAVFCDGDYRAKLIYETAKKLRLKIPDDISVVGYFNTPWCEIFQPNLTSVSIREENMADYVVKEITDKNVNKEIIISPKLIIRKSTNFAN